MNANISTRFSLRPFFRGKTTVRGSDTVRNVSFRTISRSQTISYHVYGTHLCDITWTMNEFSRRFSCENFNSFRVGKILDRFVQEIILANLRCRVLRVIAQSTYRRVHLSSQYQQTIIVVSPLLGENNLMFSAPQCNNAPWQTTLHT